MLLTGEKKAGGKMSQAKETMFMRLDYEFLRNDRW